MRREIRLVVEHLCDTEGTLLNRNERERLIEEVLDETFGLGPLELLLKDHTISDIMINGPKSIYVERRGRVEKTAVTFPTTNTCCRLSIGSCRRWAAGSTKSARWSMPV